MLKIWEDLVKMNKLEINTLYKYKQLCSIFGEEQKQGGKSRKLQIENWSRYGKLEKRPKAYFEYLELYNNPIKKVDNRVNNGKNINSHGNNNVYAPYIDRLIASFLKEEKLSKLDIVKDKKMRKKELTTPLYLSRSIIGVKCGLFSWDYIDLKNDETNEYMHQCMGDYSIYNTYFNIVNMVRNLERVVDGALDRLEEKEFIEKEFIYMVVMDEVKGIDDEGDFIIEECTREADEGEAEYILKCQEEIKKELGVNTFVKLGQKKRREAYAEINKRVQKKYENLKKIFKVYKIYVKDLDNIEKVNYKNEFNNFVFKHICEQYAKKITKKLNDFEYVEVGRFGIKKKEVVDKERNLEIELKRPSYLKDANLMLERLIRYKLPNNNFKKELDFKLKV